MAYEPFETRYLRRFLAGGHRRGVARTKYVALIATVRVSADPLNPRRYRAHDDRNIQAIESALAQGEEDAIVTMQVIGSRVSFLARVDDALAHREDFNDLWSDLLGVEVLEVISWAVEPVRPRP